MAPVMELELTGTTRRRLALAAFLLALAVRVAFWQATPDRGWPHSALYKGDAVTWVEYAAAIRDGREFELGLPLRPPGNGYLLALIGVEGPGDVARAKLVWCALGAASVALLLLAAADVGGLAAGLVVAVWCAFSTGLLIQSTSLNNETPYLTLVAAILALTPRLLNKKPAAGTLLAWGALHALACLFRVEHALFFALSCAWLVREWRPAGRTRGLGRPLARLAVAGLAFAAVLAPWHLASWLVIERFNREPMALGAAGDAAQEGVERATAGLAWTPEARQARAALPGFARRTAANFVAATVLVRGGREVRAEDFAILEEAFGYAPEPLSRRPFVALYGPLNFYLANRAGAPPGFDPRGLDLRPPLAGGLERYPVRLLAGLPPRELAFVYPPHVELINDGYRLGWRWIRENPGAFVRRAGSRLAIAWQGAALGWTGYGLPWGLDGVRPAVDLAVPRSAGFSLWQAGLLAVCLAGAWIARSKPAAVPWLLFAAAKLVAAGFFFGYARHGVTLIPVVALLAGLGADRVLRRFPVPPRRLVAAAAAVAVLGLAIEGARCLRPPELTLDGRPVAEVDPLPLREHLNRRVEAR